MYDDIILMFLIKKYIKKLKIVKNKKLKKFRALNNNRSTNKRGKKFRATYILNHVTYIRAQELYILIILAIIRAQELCT